MPRRSRSWAGFVVPGAGGAGLLAGHALVYRLTHPDVVLRNQILERTGHAYLRPASFVAASLAVASAMLILRIGYRSVHDRHCASLPWAGSAVALGVVQTAGFVVQELVERVVTGAPLHDFGGRFLLLGIVVQVLVALVAAFVAVVLFRAGRCAAGSGSRVRALAPQARGIVAQTQAGAPRTLHDPRSNAVRAPPQRLLAS
jgi:hypothetical protein